MTEGLKCVRTCLCQEIVGEGKPDALHESFKLKTEKMSNI